MKISERLREISSPVTDMVLEARLKASGELFLVEGMSLASDNPWRTSKWEEGLQTAKLAGDIFRGEGLSAETLNLIRLMCAVHDLGRLRQAYLKQEGIPFEQQNHGQVSVELLTPILADPLMRLWQPVAEAIEYHSLKDTPDSEKFASETGKVLCWILRDLDKAGGFSKAAKYLLSDEKRRQAKVNDLSARSPNNPTAETMAIETVPGNPDVLEEFLAGRTVVRAHCASYEAYMLQFLGWLADFNVDEIRNRVIADGGPSIVLNYLREQLGEESTEFQRISGHSRNKWGL